MPRSAPRHIVLISVVVAVAAVATVAFVTRHTTEPEIIRPTPFPGLQAVATDVELVPKQDTRRRLQITADLGRALTRLYTKTFVAPVPTPAPTTSPVPDRLKGLFTPLARSSLHTRGGVFTLQRGLEITSGRIGYSGVVTIDGNTPAAALIDIDFRAIARRINGEGPDIQVRQNGTLSLVRRGSRWLVDGFDELHLATKPIPSPIPTPG